MTNWLRKLIPKQENFFPLFNEHARKIEGVAQQLRLMLDGDASVARDDLSRTVGEGRQVSAQILDLIRQSFVTPFDRTDIKQMTASMQASIEVMNVAGLAVADDPHVDLAEFGALVVGCASEVARGVSRLGELDTQADELKQMRERVGARHREMTQLRENTMRQLLQRGGADAVAMLTGTFLVERLASVVEHLDAVANHIDDLVLSHV